MTIVEGTRPVTGGVDTHLDVHVAAALDDIGGLLGVESLEVSPAGNDKLLGWLASSGKVTRYRLNRGGDRQANAALYVIVITRMNSDPRTRAYVARRLEEGKPKADIIRILKRYVAREVYRYLPRN